jgi:hypothetical protein
VSLQIKILNLLSGITDPTTRIDISTTINFFYQLFTTGRAREDEIRDSLFEVLVDVLKFKNPELLDEEVKKRAREMVEEFITAFRVESMARRTYTRFRPRLF